MLSICELNNCVAKLRGNKSVNISSSLGSNSNIDLFLSSSILSSLEFYKNSEARDIEQTLNRH